MFTSIIMMNIKNIFVTTGLSVLFGVYSIYNLFEYFRVLNNNQIKQIKDLQNKLINTNKKYNYIRKQNNDLEQKYNLLEQTYSDLEQNYNKLTVIYKQKKEEIDDLHLKIYKLEEKENDNISIIISSDNDTSNIIDNSKIFGTNNIICDELCDLNNNIPRINMFTGSPNSKNMDDDFFETISFKNLEDHNCSIKTETNSLCNSENDSIKYRSRSTSITEIDWLNLTKKFFFG